MWFKLIFLPVSYYDETSSGETVSRVVNDTNIVKDLISEHFPQFVTGVISIIGAVTILLVMDWKMTLIMMIAVPITIAVLLPLGRRMAKISRGLRDESAVFRGNVEQTLSEIRIMKSSNAEEVEKKNGINRIYETCNFSYYRVCWNACGKRHDVYRVTCGFFTVFIPNYYAGNVVRYVLYPATKGERCNGKNYWHFRVAV